MRIQDNQVVGVSYLVIEDRRYWGYVKMEQKKGDNIWFVANAYKVSVAISLFKNSDL
jgi:hypothetical protein